MSAARRRKLAKELHRFLHAERMFREYLTPAKKYGTWLSGSCWRLSRAFVLWAHADHAAVKTVPLRNVMTGQIEHVVARVGDCFLDGDGLSVESELIDRWARLEGVTVFVGEPVTQGRLGSNTDFVPPDAAMKRLASELQEHFGDLGQLLDEAGC